MEPAIEWSTLFLSAGLFLSCPLGIFQRTEISNVLNKMVCEQVMQSVWKVNRPRGAAYRLRI